MKFVLLAFKIVIAARTESLSWTNNDIAAVATATNAATMMTENPFSRKNFIRRVCMSAIVNATLLLVEIRLELFQTNHNYA